MALDRLWAGWRSAYIDDVVTGGRPEGCLFCGLQEAEDEAALILERTPLVYAVMNAYPYCSGHVMVIPVRHEATFTGLTDPEAAALMAEARRIATAVEAEYRPEGLNVGINVGRAGGAGVPEHLHLHVVPRWHGDTNFMTAVAETRVLPESVDASRRRLLARLATIPEADSGAADA
ncbi:MAG: HIT family protein [Actinomycetes bacterium]